MVFEHTYTHAQPGLFTEKLKYRYTLTQQNYTHQIHILTAILSSLVAAIVESHAEKHKNNTIVEIIFSSEIFNDREIIKELRSI